MSSLALNHKFFMLRKVEGGPKGPPFGFFFGTMRKGTPLNFSKFSICKKRLIGLEGIVLGFSAICDFFYQILFFEKKIYQVFPIVGP